MFNRGLDALFEALPSLDGLPPAELKRLLAGAWLDAVDQRDLAGPPTASRDVDRLRCGWLGPVGRLLASSGGECVFALPFVMMELHHRARDLLVSMLLEIADHQPVDRERLLRLAAAADPAAVGYLLGIIDSHDARLAQRTTHGP